MNLTPSKYFTKKRVIALRILLSAIVLSAMYCDKPHVVNPSTDVSDIPMLMIPLPDAVMDNGCVNKTIPVSWFFSWTSVQGASMYELWIKKHYSTSPTFDLQLSEIQYTWQSYTFITEQDSENWIWKVRCLINGKWSDWSPDQIFQVGPAQTNCP